MNNRFALSSNFRVNRERTGWNIEAVMAKVYNLSHGRAALIAAILADARPEVSPTPGQQPCRKG
ncbi:MAG: hypothetical protein ACREDV_02255 [Methylocella sp.]